LEEKPPTVAVTVALAAPPETSTVAGTVTIPELLDNAMAAPPVPAALDKVTEQVALDPGFRMLEEHESELTTVRVVSAMDAVAELPPYPAVSVAV
jgi:hypothetical protein